MATKKVEGVGSDERDACYSSSNASHSSTSQKSNTSRNRKKGKNDEKFKRDADKCDRFVPNRGAMNLDSGLVEINIQGGDDGDTSEHVSSNKTSSITHAAESDGSLSQALESSIAGDIGYSSSCSESSVEQSSERVLAFKRKAPPPSAEHINSLKVLYSQAPSNMRSIAAAAKLTRHVPSTPEKMLDAPGLIDDFYLNLVSWSSNNLLAVALGSAVYIWNPTSGDIIQIPALNDESNYVCSVRFSEANPNFLGIGVSTSKTQIWDVKAKKQVRNMDGHSSRISSLSWNRSCLSTGGKDGNVIHHDVRVANHNVCTLKGHLQEVCSLEWSPSGNILASGSNDNKVNLWDANVLEGFYQTSPRATLTDHQAAVKAIGWSPFESNVLATGGGTADRTIKFWNAMNGNLLNSIDTGTQVCALQWSRTEKEILSSHGFNSNSICLWKYPSMIKVKELKGHTRRVLHLAQSPNGQMVVSAAADETLRFWNVFAAPSKSIKKKTQSTKFSSRCIGIR